VFHSAKTNIRRWASLAAAITLVVLFLLYEQGATRQIVPWISAEIQRDSANIAIGRLLGSITASVPPKEMTAATLSRRTVIGTNGWIIEDVDNGVIGSIDLALDGDGKAHISYDADGLYSAKQISGDWHQVMVDTSAYHTSLAVDPQGNEHILYFEGPLKKDTLKYAYEKAEGWNISVLDLSELLDDPVAELGAGRYNDLAVDESGKAHMTFSTWRCTAWMVGGDCFRWDPDAMYYLKPTDEQWQSMIAGYRAEYGSITLDAGDDAHISYYNEYGAYLTYTCYDFLSYYPGVGTRIDESADVGQYSSIVVESRVTPQQPHIAYYDADHGDLKHTYATGPDVWHLSWFSETVDTGGEGGDVGQYASMALDSSGFPHIAYYDAVGESLKYAYQDKNGWHTDTVDDTANVGHWSSLAIDKAGNVHIAYVDETNSVLKYANKASEAGLTEHTLYVPFLVR
jgi:hypothetical protein